MSLDDMHENNQNLNIINFYVTFSGFSLLCMVQYIHLPEKRRENIFLALRLTLK